MEHRDAFSGCHPAVNLLFFGLVIVFAMFLMHPVCLMISAVSALAYLFRLKGGRALRSRLLFLLPMALMAAAVNPAFNHRGATLLAYLPTGNPLTLESIAYGLAAALMLFAVVCWFSCCSEVITSDKLLYLFGRLIPALSLALSMALRFVPKCRDQLRAVVQAQRCLGRDISRGSLLRRARGAITVFSILVTWALEDAMETADSMKSRGYGLPGRTAFSIYCWESRDRWLLAWLAGCGFFLVCGWAAGGFGWRYFPTMKGAAPSPPVLCLWLGYLALCLTPAALDWQQHWAWKLRGTEQ